MDGRKGPRRGARMIELARILLIWKDNGRVRRALLRERLGPNAAHVLARMRRNGWAEVMTVRGTEFVRLTPEGKEHFRGC